MKSSELGSSQWLSSRIASGNSSRVRLSTIGRRKVGCERNMASVLLQQRQTVRIIHNDVDVTPKPLIHSKFHIIDENQMTALETCTGLFQIDPIASSSLLLTSPSKISIKSNSSILLKTSPIISDDMLMESLLSTEVTEVPVEDEVDVAPTPFFVLVEDPSVFPTRPESVTITLKETNTFFIFELLPVTEDIRTPEGEAVQRENENYDYVTVGPGSNRKLLDAETQTMRILTKSRGTHLGLRSRQNQGIYANNWIIHDILANPELMMEKNGRLIVHSKESMRRLREAQELRHKLPSPEIAHPTVDEQLTHIYWNTRFSHVARVVERIIANNVFAMMQKRFTGLIRLDPCDLDLKFDYRLELLWTHTCEMVYKRPVSACRWCPSNSIVIAVAYGAKTGSDKVDGMLLIWSAKSPSQPSRDYLFSSPLSDIDWSRDRPNLMAVGLYDGTIKVIDISSKKLNIIRQSRRETSPARLPHWQVQWWSADKHFDKEHICTSDQHGRVYQYQFTEDFVASTIMGLYRMEGTLDGVARTDHCVSYDVLISRRPAALVLRRHPVVSNIYLVGSDEGCIYRCSTHYLNQHIDSFLAHDGPIYSIEFSPFCQKLFLTCGADWCIRLWVEDITVEPLITLSTDMACVRSVCWSPICSTILASIINNQICIWNIRRKIHAPVSVTTLANGTRLIAINITANGDQLVVADLEGAVYVYSMEGVSFPPYDQTKVLIESVYKGLVTKPELIKKLKKLGPPFDDPTE